MAIRKRDVVKQLKQAPSPVLVIKIQSNAMLVNGRDSKKLEVLIGLAHAKSVKT